MKPPQHQFFSPIAKRPATTASPGFTNSPGELVNFGNLTRLAKFLDRKICTVRSKMIDLNPGATRTPSNGLLSAPNCTYEWRNNAGPNGQFLNRNPEVPEQGFLDS